MKKGKDFSAKFSDIYIVHQNIPDKRTQTAKFSEHILFIPLSGEIKIQFKDQTVTSGPGHMIYLPANFEHQFSSSEHNGERLIVMFKNFKHNKKIPGPLKSPINQLIKEVLFYLLVKPKTKMAKSLAEVFKQALDESLENSNLTDDHYDHLISKIQDQRLLAAIDYIDKSFDQNLSVEKVAKESGLSPRNLTRLILNETGMTLKQWVTYFRVEKAKSLLSASNVTVTEVALEVGYSSLSQFISVFRSRTGQLPSQFTQNG